MNSSPPLHRIEDYCRIHLASVSNVIQHGLAAISQTTHMMQSLTQEMTTLRRVIRHWLKIKKVDLKKAGWSGRASRATSRNLALDLGLPVEVVSRVLDQAAADLRNLGAMDDAADPRPVVNKAVDELAKFGFHSQPFDAAALDRCLQELAEPDLDILRHFKQGMKQAEIAALMGTDVETVRRSLVRTYAGLRIKMMGWQDGDDGDSLVPESNPKRLSASISHSPSSQAAAPRRSLA